MLLLLQEQEKNFCKMMLKKGHLSAIGAIHVKYELTQEIPIA
jgi:hypothetical protein